MVYLELENEIKNSVEFLKADYNEYRELKNQNIDQQNILRMKQKEKN